MISQERLAQHNRNAYVSSPRCQARELIYLRSVGEMTISGSADTTFVRLLHCPQGVVNESSTAFLISANRMRLAYDEKIQPHRAWRCPHARTPLRGVGSRHRLRQYQRPSEPALDREGKRILYEVWGERSSRLHARLSRYDRQHGERTSSSRQQRRHCGSGRGGWRSERMSRNPKICGASVSACK